MFSFSKFPISLDHTALLSRVGMGQVPKGIGEIVKKRKIERSASL